MMSNYDRKVIDVENETMPETPVAGLREWAQGLYPLEAATELLIRAGKAQEWRPWVHPCDDYAGDPDRAHWHYIDFASIPDLIGGASGGERRLMLFAAALSGRVKIDKVPPLDDLVCGVDRETMDLMLAAVAHASGSHQGSRIVFAESGRPVRFEPTGSLHPWPEPTQ